MDHCIYSMYLPGGSGERVFFGKLSIVSSVDFVVG